MRAFENVRDFPTKIMMALRRERYDAHPFDLWWPNCPMCVHSYEGHEFSGLGASKEPWDAFVSAI